MLDKEGEDTDGFISEESGTSSTKSCVGKRIKILIGILASIGIVIVALVILGILYWNKGTSTSYYNPYRVVGFKDSKDRFFIHLKNQRTESEIEPRKELKELTVEIVAGHDHLLSVKINATDQPRWDVANALEDLSPTKGHVIEDVNEYIKAFEHYTLKELHVNVSNDTFSWKLLGSETQKLGKKALIDTFKGEMKYAKEHIIYEMTVPCQNIFGLPQASSKIFLDEGNYTFWNRYKFSGEKGEEGIGGINFLLCKIEKEKYTGIFMDTSNAHTVSIKKEKEKEMKLKYQLAGGIIDLKVFHLGDPLSIIKIYHGFIGKPACPPLWSFGLGQSKEGCKDTETLEKMVNDYISNNIPLDSIWMDQLLMNNYASFTVDPVRYKGLAEKIASWKEKGINFVQTFLPQLKVNSEIYTEVIQHNIPILDPSDKTKPLTSKGKDTGDCGFMDILTNDSWKIFKTTMNKLSKTVPYKGIWIRQETPYTTCDGPCYYNNEGYDYEPVPLQNNTIPLNSQYKYSENSKEFNVHGIYPLLNAEAISKVAKEDGMGEKLRITSSVAAPRLGQYATLWRGSINSSWESLKQIIAETISYNMAGIPFVGYPVCGYNKVDQDLCLKWYQLSVYLPEMRIHHDGTSTKELKEKPYQLAIQQRYRIIRFLYTKFFETELWGGSIWEPLSFSFPNDDNCTNESVIENTFFIGRTLYVAPKLTSGKESTKVYLPNSHWYSLHNYSLVKEYKEGGEGKEIEFATSDDYSNVFIKGGRILPLQNEPVTSTKQLNELPVTLLVAPDHEKKAKGTMVVSEDKNSDIQLKNYAHYSFTYVNGMFRSNIIEGYTYEILKNTELLKEIVILDSSLKHIKYACALTSDLKFHELQISYTASHLIITAPSDLKVYLKNIDSITFGENVKDNLCKRKTTIHSLNFKEEGRVAQVLVNSSNGITHNAKFTLLANKILYLSMEPTNRDIWKPEEVLVEGTKRRRSANNNFTMFSLSIAKGAEPFGFSIGAPGARRVLRTEGDFLMEGDRFIKFDLVLNSDKIYGLGERITEFELADGIYTLFCKSQKSFVDDHKLSGKNMYGAHSFYMFHINGDLFAGIFILTTHPLDVIISTKGSEKTLTHVIASSVLELFFIQTSEANEVLAEYHSLIGKPVLVPYWSFGYHQCRWGYDNIDKLKEVVDNFAAHNIPLDVLWNDIDYMVDYEDFTLDETRYKGMDAFLNDLKKKGITYVPILDAGIARKDTYEAYKDGIKKGVFLNSKKTGEPLVGVVWPGFAVFTDFTHQSADDYWHKYLTELHNKLPFDGLWLDMNEPTNFCDGECSDELHYADKEFTTDEEDMLIYYVGHKKLNDITVSLDAIHANGVSEYNLHNLHGFYITRTANYYFTKLKKRPFIISRSTFPGLGRYGSHWLGDNYSREEFMRYSLSGIYNFQMFGIPFVGADVCGFAGKANIELCKRWMQLGAFYPFYRNHKEIDSGVQEPYVDPKLAAISVHAIKTRYKLFRYMYSQYFSVSLNGGAFFTPLFWHFPDDDEAYKHNEKTFLLGPHLKISPCLASSGIQPISSYFPNTDWYELFIGKKVMAKGSSGKQLELPCTLEPTPILNIHVAGGSIIPLNIEGNNLALTLENAINLVVVPLDDMAKGVFYYDDDDVDTIKNKNYQIVNLSMSKETLEFTTGEKKFAYKYKDNIFNEIKIYNAAAYKDTKCAHVTLKTGDPSKSVPTYDAQYEVLTIKANIEIEKIVKVTWSNTPCN